MTLWYEERLVIENDEYPRRQMVYLAPLNFHVSMNVLLIFVAQTNNENFPM